MSTADEVNKVVEKLSEKASEAVGFATPLAERVVQEYQTIHIMGAIGWGLLDVF